jgi:CHAD domain-containing protein
MLLEDLMTYMKKDAFREEDYHRMRILSKETRYVLELWQRCIAEHPSLSLVNDHLRGLHQALGHWHDGVIALTCLQEYDSRYAQKPYRNPGAYELYAHHLQEEQRGWLDKFMEDWRAFTALSEIRQLAIVLSWGSAP